MVLRSCGTSWLTKLNLVVSDKEQQTTFVKSVAIPTDKNIREKIKTYQLLKEQLEQMQRVKAKVLPVEQWGLW
ncbi:uncharacterized protein LOC121618519 [Tachysurus ichikawai]